MRTGLQIESLAVASSVYLSDTVAQIITAILFAVQTQALVKRTVVSTSVSYHLVVRVQQGVSEEVDSSLMSTFDSLWYTCREECSLNSLSSPSVYTIPFTLICCTFQSVLVHIVIYVYHVTAGLEVTSVWVKVSMSNRLPDSHRQPNAGLSKGVDGIYKRCIISRQPIRSRNSLKIGTCRIQTCTGRVNNMLNSFKTDYRFISFHAGTA